MQSGRRRSTKALCGDTWNPQITPIQVGVNTNWQTLSVGTETAMATKSDGTLWTWGCNGDGQVGIGRTGNGAGEAVDVQGTNWASVAPGAIDSFAIKTDGSPWGWGDKKYRQVGKDTMSTVKETLTVAIGTNATWKSASAGYNFAVAIASGS